MHQDHDGERRAQLLAAYDEQLRGEAEVAGALTWDRSGPLYRGLLGNGGFVSYESLALVSDVDALIVDTVAHFAGIPEIDGFEWKTRGHDEPADLGVRLEKAGLVPEEVETVMVGEATHLADEVALPDGVVVRRVDQLADRGRIVGEATRLHLAVFGGGPSAEEIIDRLDRRGPLEQFWVAEVGGPGGEVISAGRLSLVDQTEFAGLWGGATAPKWRGRGVYRALTADRARAAIAEGRRFLHSDCTAMSRPILERSGLVAVTTTTPYVWHR